MQPPDPPADVVCVGLTTLDLLYTVPRHPDPDEKVVAERQELAAGGPAANAAVTASVLGSRTVLVTALGRHPLARVARDDLRSHGVEVIDVTPDDDGPPAVSSVAVQPATARRSVISVNAARRSAPAPAGLDVLVASAGALLVDGHHPDLARTALHAARAGGVTTLMDGGSWKPELDADLGLVDWAVCGARFRVPGHADEAATARALLRRGVSVVAFSHADEPVTWRTATGHGSVGVPPVAAVDTLGAGDALHGALVHDLAHGAERTGPRAPGPGAAEIEDTLARACAVAALRVSVAGPRAWLTALGSARPPDPGRT